MKKLLIFDSCAGLSVGLMMWLLDEQLCSLILKGMPLDVLRAVASVNIAYGLFSGSLALQAQRGELPVGLIRVLIAANAAWLPVCVLIAAFVEASSPLGAAYIAYEGVVVASMAAFEYHVLTRHLQAQRG